MATEQKDGACTREMQGFLSKQTARLKRFTKRFFSLHGSKPGLLEYFSDAERQEFLGGIPLEDSIITSRDMPTRQIFCLQTTYRDGKLYILEAPNSKTMKSWFEALENHGSIIHKPIKQGFLDLKQTKKIGIAKWKKLYFVQFDSVLEYYKDITSEVPSGVIPLPAVAEIKKETSPDILAGKKSAFSILSTQDHGCKPVYISSDDDSIVQSWMESLQDIIGSKEIIEQYNPNSFKEGYLMKSNAMGVDWKKRYFVLLEDRIQYFGKRGDKKCAGEISLYGTTKIEVASTTGSSHDYRFQIQPTEDEGERTYHLKTVNKNNLLAWTDLIEKIIADKPTKLFNDSLKEGYLSREKHALWNKRYFVLFDDRVEYYKKMWEKSSLEGKFLLVGEAKLAYQEGNRKRMKNYVFSILATQDEGEKEIYMASNTDDDRKDWYTQIDRVLKTKDPEELVHQDSNLEGYLYKTSGTKGMHWNKRYFVLFDDRIEYYKQKRGEKYAGVIPLPGESVIDLDEQNNREWTFIVANSKDQGARKYVISAPSKQIRDQWIDTLKNILAEKKVESVKNGSLKEGYLWKEPHNLPGVKQKWQKLYFALFENHLCYYKKKLDENPVGEIGVLGGSIAQIEPRVMIGKKVLDNIFSVLESECENVHKCRLSAESDEDRKEWVNDLQNLIGNKVLRLDDNSLMEGYLIQQKNTPSVNTPPESPNTSVRILKSPKPTGSKFNPSAVAAMMAPIMKKGPAKRYCVLLEDKIDFYKNIKETPVANVLLRGGAYAKPGNNIFDKGSGDSAIILAAGEDEGEKEYILFAKNTAERDEWLEQISEIIDRKPLKRMSHSIKEGYMYKIGFGGVFWSKVYFILLNDKLQFYKRKYDKDPQGVINLYAQTMVESEDEEKHGRTHIFSILVSLDERERKHWISTNTSESLNDWISAINQIIATKEVTTVVLNSLKEGYVKRRNVLHQWQNRYCVLISIPGAIASAPITVIRFYKNKHDDTASQEIRDLALSTVRLEDEFENAFSLIFTAPETEKISKHVVITNSSEDLASWIESIRLAGGKVDGRPVLFGGDLSEGMDRSPYEAIPEVVIKCIAFLGKNGLSTVGIFRVPGNNDRILELQASFENNEDIELKDVNSVAGLLKKYYRELKIPLIPFEFYQKFITIDDFEEDDEKSSQLLEIVKELPDDNAKNLNYIINFLVTVSDNSEQNKMTTKNCAMVFAPSLIRKPEKADAVIDPMAMMKEVDAQKNVLEILIANFNQIFPEGPFTLRKKPLVRDGPIFNGILEDAVIVSIYCDLPTIVVTCIEFLKKNALKVEGLFRVPGSAERIQELEKIFEADKIPTLKDPHSAAGIFKLYFRKLKNPLIPFEQYEQFIDIGGSYANRDDKYNLLKDACEALPKCNFDTLNYCLHFLTMVTKNASINMMGSNNCAMVFSAGMLREPEGSEVDPSKMMKIMESSQNVIELLIDGYKTIFPNGPIPVVLKSDTEDAILPLISSTPNHVAPSSTITTTTTTTTTTALSPPLPISMPPSLLSNQKSPRKPPPPLSKKPTPPLSKKPTPPLSKKPTPPLSKKPTPPLSKKPTPPHHKRPPPPPTTLPPPAPVSAPPSLFSEKHTAPPPMLSEKRIAPPSLFSEKHTAPPPMLSEKKVSPPSLFSEKHTAPPPMLSEKKVAPPSLSSGKHTAPPPLFSEKKVAPPSLFSEKHTAPPPLFGEKSSPPLPSKKNIAPPPLFSEKRVAPPPLPSAHVSPPTSHKKIGPPPLFSEKRVAPPPLLSEKRIVPPPLLSEKRVAPPPLLSEKRVAPPPLLSEKRVAPPPLLSEKNVSKENIDTNSDAKCRR